MLIHFIVFYFVITIICKYNPIPNPDAVVKYGNSRFTILTPNVIRMEYSDKTPPVFYDEPSFTVLNRELEVPKFTHNLMDNMLTIETDQLQLNYDTKQAFTSSSLSIKLKIPPSTIWYFGSPRNGSLHGAVRTLDGVSGGVGMNCQKLSWEDDRHCEEGLISTNGWSIIDDSEVVRMDNDDWQYPARPLDDALNKNYKDYYFFGHGHNYRQALYDFTLLSGKTPVPPRYALGVHYSRYYGYTDQEELEIVQSYFEANNIPLDVLVIDIDWHRTFPRGIDPNPHHIDINGWTGFSWDPKMFQNPSTFLQYLTQRGLAISLNLHPGAGVQFFEDKYSEMAKAVGIDPSTDQTVPFNITDKIFAQKFYDIVMKPLDDQGITFWWIDWQQGESTIIPHLNPTILTNHLWFTYPNKFINNERHWILGRWGGYGNHRYPIGFSGDTITNWDSLKFQIYFNYISANVLYQWGHDLGGHSSHVDDNLYIRWVQFGAASSSFRPHCTKGYDIFRDPWKFQPKTISILRRTMNFRESIVPYLEKYFIYSYETGLQPVHGLYYDYPEDNNVYTYQYQYMLGNDFIVSPIHEDGKDILTNLTLKETYLPSGNWMGYFNGKIYTTNIIKENYLLNEMPLFVKVGSIIPLNTISSKLSNAKLQTKTLILNHFLGNITNDIVYENYILDTDGRTNGFADNELINSTITTTLNNNGNNVTIIMKYKDGKGFPELLSNRNILFKLTTVYPPKVIYVNGKDIPYDPFASPNEHMEGSNFNSLSWSYTINDLSLYIYLPSVGIKDTININIIFEQRIDNNLYNGLISAIHRSLLCKDLLDKYYGTVYVEDYPSLLKLSGLGTLYLGEATYNNILSTMKLVNEYKTKSIDELSMIKDDKVLPTINSCLSLINDI